MTITFAGVTQTENNEAAVYHAQWTASVFLFSKNAQKTQEKSFLSLNNQL